MLGRAAICHVFGEPLVIDNISIDPPQAGEVVVRIAATGICHSDIHLVRGEWGTIFGAPPLIAGHEAAGYVAACGPGVTTVQEGDQVIVSFLRSCGHCRFCTNGSPYMCDTVFPMDETSRLRAADGRVVRAWGPATFAEFSIVDQSQVVPIPADIPLDQACLLGCAVVTGVGAVFNTARVSANSSVLVIGAGGVGLNVVQAARIAGANPIIAVDTQAERCKLAQTLGATHVINPADHNNDTVAAVAEIVGLQGIDYAFIAVGSPQAVSQGFHTLGRQGTVVIIGEFGPDATITLPAEPFVFERKVIGCFMGSPHYQTDFARLIDWYRSNQLQLKPLVSGHYPLDQINTAIAAVEQGQAVRNIVLL